MASNFRGQTVQIMDLSILYDRIKILEEEKKELQKEIEFIKNKLRNTIIFPNKSNKQKNRKRR